MTYSLPRHLLYNTFYLATKQPPTVHTHAPLWTASSSLNIPVIFCGRGRCPMCSRPEKWYKYDKRSQNNRLNRKTWDGPQTFPTPIHLLSKEQAAGEGKDLAINHIAFSLCVPWLMTFNCSVQRLLKSIKRH